MQGLPEAWMGYLGVAFGVGALLSLLVARRMDRRTDQSPNVRPVSLRGPRVAEYVTILVMIAAVAIATLWFFGGQVTTILSTHSGGV